MKASDIKEVKPFGNYSADTQLGYFERKITEWVNEGLELCPDFQRGHVWTERQQVAFVEFILKGGKTNPILFNHSGWMRDFEGEFVCVDGLQRITAIIKFLNNELAVFGGHCRADIEGIDKILQRVFIKMYVNDLKTRKEVIEWYIELNSGGTPHTEEELERVKGLLKAFT